NSALRIRERNDTYTLTLKQPKEEGILETHESLSKNQALSWINGIDRSSSPYINDTLKQENISINDLVYFGSLRTERYQFKDETITYVLDKSTYNYTTDYELEIE